MVVLDRAYIFFIWNCCFRFRFLFLEGALHNASKWLFAAGWNNFSFRQNNGRVAINFIYLAWNFVTIFVFIIYLLDWNFFLQLFYVLIRWTNISVTIIYHVNDALVAKSIFDVKTKWIPTCKNVFFMWQTKKALHGQVPKKESQIEIVF